MLFLWILLGIRELALADIAARDEQNVFDDQKKS
jgi:hypothetical protein